MARKKSTPKTTKTTTDDGLSLWFCPGCQAKATVYEASGITEIRCDACFTMMLKSMHKPKGYLYCTPDIEVKTLSK